MDSNKIDTILKGIIYSTCESLLNWNADIMQLHLITSRTATSCLHYNICVLSDERRLSAFTLSVGNSSDVNDHTQCASHNGAVAAGATVNESCTATGRYLSFRRSGGEENQLTTLCEVVVIGHRYISTYLLCAFVIFM